MNMFKLVAEQGKQVCPKCDITKREENRYVYCKCIFMEFWDSVWIIGRVKETIRNQNDFAIVNFREVLIEIKRFICLNASEITTKIVVIILNVQWFRQLSFQKNILLPHMTLFPETKIYCWQVVEKQINRINIDRQFVRNPTYNICSEDLNKGFFQDNIESIRVSVL